MNLRSLAKKPNKNTKNRIDNIKQNFNTLSRMSIILKFLNFQKKYYKLFNFLSNFEENFFNIDKVEIREPVFICGMARSGTTFLTHLLDSTGNFSTFKYKYLPFYKVPIFWSYINFLFFLKKKRKQRFHGDALKVDINSPDSFEELIWKNNLENYENKGYWQNIIFSQSKYLSKNLKTFIRKTIHINKKKKYLSKNNNNIFRIKYLLEKFPDAKIIIVIRNPIDLAFSSAKVHFRFLKFHENINDFSKELSELGHYEFGYNRKLFNLNKSDSFKTNIRFKTIKFYLEKYSDLLNFILKNYSEEIKEKKIVIFNYDNLKKLNDLSRLLKFLEIEDFSKLEKYFNNNFFIKEKNKNFKFKKKIVIKDFEKLSKYSII